VAEPIKYAIGPDGRIINYEPHHQALKPGWREATEAEVAAAEDLEAIRAAKEPPDEAKAREAAGLEGVAEKLAENKIRNAAIRAITDGDVPIGALSFVDSE
jgi:hypothetical protein